MYQELLVQSLFQKQHSTSPVIGYYILLKIEERATFSKILQNVFSKREKKLMVVGVKTVKFLILFHS